MERIQLLLENSNKIQDKNSRIYHFNLWLLAKEYFKYSDYQNALQYTIKILSFYKKSGWVDLMISIVNLGIRAAYYNGNVIEFIKLSLEVLGGWNFYLNDNQKILIQKSIIDLFKLKLPENLDFLTTSQEQQQLSLNQFKENLQKLNKNELNEQQKFTIKMSENISSFIDAKVIFRQDNYYADELIDLDCYLYLRTPESIQFDNLKIKFLKDYYNQFCMCNLNDNHLLPNKLYEFNFQLKPNPQDANQQLDIDCLELNLGLNNFRITCEWSFKSNLNYFTDYNLNSSIIKQSDDLKFKYLRNQTSTFLNYKKPLIDFKIEHNDNALFDENFTFNLILVNNELDDIRNLELYIKQFREQNDYEELLNEFNCDDCDLQIFDNAKFIKISLTKCLKKDTKFIKTIFMKCKTNSNLILDFSLSYFVKAIDHYNSKLNNLNQLDQKQQSIYHTCSIKRSINLNTKFPFENLFLIQNLLKTNDNYWPKCHEPFYLQIKLISNSSIQINSIDFLLNTNSFVLEDYNNDLNEFNMKSNLNNKIFKPGDELIENIKLYSKHESTIKLNLGFLIMKWKRLDDKLSISPLNETKILLPEFTIKPSLIFIDNDFPNYGFIKQRFNVNFKIYNRTDAYLPMLFTIDDNINFLYSGNKQKKIYIEPKNYWVETVSFLPMFCGFLRLPKIKLIAYPNTINTMTLDDTVDEILPSFLKIIVSFIFDCKFNY